MKNSNETIKNLLNSNKKHIGNSNFFIVLDSDDGEIELRVENEIYDNHTKLICFDSLIDTGDFDLADVKNILN